VADALHDKGLFSVVGIVEESGEPLIFVGTSVVTAAEAAASIRSGP
jgi:hypothetical protein